MINFEQQLQNELVDTYLKSVEEYDKSHCAFEDSEIIAAYEAAIEGLKKQTPTQPVKIAAGNYICPICQFEFFTTDIKYCNRCGQCLDWSEAEE